MAYPKPIKCLVRGLVKIPTSSMVPKGARLDFKPFLYRSLHLPHDTLLSKLLPFLQTSIPLWRTCIPSADTMDTRTFKLLKQIFLQNNLESRRDGPNSKLLSACRPTLTVDPILWLPMSYIERSLNPNPCLYHLNADFSRSHVIYCLHMHQHLFFPVSIDDLLSFLLNFLPTTKPRQSSEASSWFVRWPIICIILHKLDHLFNHKLPPPLSHPGRPFLTWLSCD
ncbi:MAG: hypothetical protein EXX96DRAFT_601795 [Benjaminiella poitrasii]|nr:MAG: hypothetical protein EXX96DRAFT_601795 [Benjaminiella poitrasii]